MTPDTGAKAVPLGRLARTAQGAVRSALRLLRALLANFFANNGPQNAASLA